MHESKQFCMEIQTAIGKLQYLEGNGELWNTKELIDKQDRKPAITDFDRIC